MSVGIADGEGERKWRENGRWIGRALLESPDFGNSDAGERGDEKFGETWG